MNEMLETLGRNAKEAEIVLRNLDTAKKNQVLEAVADSLVADSKALLITSCFFYNSFNFLTSYSTFHFYFSFAY